MLRLPIADQARQLALVGLLDRLRDIAHRTQPSAGAECSTATGQHDHPYVRVFLGAVQSRVEGGGDVSAPGVESVRPVERHDRDTGRSDLIDHCLVLARVGDEVVSGAHRPSSPELSRQLSSSLYAYCIPIGTAFCNCRYGPLDAAQTAGIRMRATR